MRASRPTAARKAAAVPVWPQTQNLFVGAGFIPPGEPCAAANIPGTMQASSPTGVCCNAGPQLPGWPPHSPPSVGADSISARGCLRRRGVRRDGGIPPYGRPEGGGRPCLAGHFGRFVGAGFIPPGALRRRRVPGTISGLRAGPAARLASETRLRAQCKHRPLQGFVVMRGRSFPVGRGIRRRPQGPAPQKQNTKNVPPCRISIAAARPRTASKL